MNKINTILVLEDDVDLNYHISELLREQPELTNFEIKSVHRIDLAREFFDEHKYEICCIITDLNMNDEWLEKQWIEETNGGLFSGWVWLQHCVYSRDPISTDTPDFKGMPHMQTIICSGYIDYFENELEDKSWLEKSNIHTISKGAGDNMGFDGLFEELKEILGIKNEEKI